MLQIDHWSCTGTSAQMHAVTIPRQGEQEMPVALQVPEYLNIVSHAQCCNFVFTSFRHAIGHAIQQARQAGSQPSNKHRRDVANRWPWTCRELESRHLVLAILPVWPCIGYTQAIYRLHIGEV